MATIEERKNNKGEKSFRVKVRPKGFLKNFEQTLLLLCIFVRLNCVKLCQIINCNAQ